MDMGTGRRPGAQPRVSVVIPAYNAEAFIQRTLASVLGQEYAELEVLVVDDGSTDDTPDIVETFRDQVRLIRQANSGVAVARNRGIAEARGEFVAFLDHDDVWYPQKLGLQVALLDARKDVGLVYANAQFIDQSDRRMWTYLAPTRLHRGAVVTALFLDCFIPLLTVVVRRHLLSELGGFVNRWHIAEDYDLFLRLAEVVQVDYVEGVVAGYRVHPGNLSRNYAQRIVEEQEVLMACLKRNPGLRRELGGAAIRLRMAGMRCEPGHVFLFQGRFRQAARYFRGRLPAQMVMALPLWLAGLLGPRFVMAARRAYRWTREGLSGTIHRQPVERPTA